MCHPVLKLLKAQHGRKTSSFTQVIKASFPLMDQLHRQETTSSVPHTHEHTHSHCPEIRKDRQWDRAGDRGAPQGAAEREPMVPHHPISQTQRDSGHLFWEVNHCTQVPVEDWGEPLRCLRHGANTSSSPTSCTSWCGLTSLDKARFALTTAQPHNGAMAPWANGL